jgi:3'-phosphoadenosine 5'-phosphosulfate (PAPS) 3'-phosphatase
MKAIMVANGEADALVYLDSWTHKWDSCAGDAIIKSMGGYFTTPYGVNITYDPNAIATENKQGMIAAIDREVFEKCMDAMSYF